MRFRIWGLGFGVKGRGLKVRRGGRWGLCRIKRSRPDEDRARNLVEIRPRRASPQAIIVLTDYSQSNGSEVAVKISRLESKQEPYLARFDIRRDESPEGWGVMSGETSECGRASGERLAKRHHLVRR
jgi:hypothetical protein